MNDVQDAQDRMNAAARGEPVTMPPQGDITYLVVERLLAMHRTLDRIGVPRFGSIKPLDTTLQARFEWYVLRSKPLRHTQKEFNHDRS